MIRTLAPVALAVALAATLVSPTPARAADDSLVLQADTPNPAPGGTATITVLVRVHPEGKSAVPVRATDVTLTAKGGGTVAPASDGAGETKWVYRAPDAVAADLDVTVEGRLAAYPDARGSCRLRVAAPKAPAPAPAPGGPAAPATAAATDPDDDGDLVENGEAVAADPVGKLVTLVKWRARPSESEEWNERDLPERGEPLYAPGLIQDFRFRVNAADARSLEIQWWRGDRPKRVRTYTEKNRRLEVSRDQDGMLNGRFAKTLGREKGEYTFSIVVTLKDGSTARENLTVHRDRPPREDEGKGRGKGGGKK